MLRERSLRLWAGLAGWRATLTLFGGYALSAWRWRTQSQHSALLCVVERRVKALADNNVPTPPRSVSVDATLVAADATQVRGCHNSW